MHLLDKFKYCPVCGSTQFMRNGIRSKHCDNCGFTFFLNASAATAAFIVNEKGELLVGRRKYEPAKDTLDLPGGFVNPGESVTDGMLREIKEEIGAETCIKRFLFSFPNFYEYSGITVPTTDMFFEVELKNDIHLIPGDDCSEIKWIAVDELEPDQFGLDSIRKAVIKYKSII